MFLKQNLHQSNHSVAVSTNGQALVHLALLRDEAWLFRKKFAHAQMHKKRAMQALQQSVPVVLIFLKAIHEAGTHLWVAGHVDQTH